ncbi:transcriptional activator RfaH [Kiloniella sp. b19]|uniref:transcriptional activator RfaH n=1 Tax=Kiloniella sp. GXU_MW_B19 TaxID=3141326 RepID=UPI0031DB625A
MKKWYVVSTHPQQEARAEENLTKQGYSVYLPCFMKKCRHARKTTVKRKALFPGYLFVSFDRKQQGWSKINNTFGVKHLITQGNFLPTVPKEFITSLQEEEQEGALLNPELKPGTAVKFLRGPFSEQIGTLCQMIDKDRVSVLFDLLGKQVKIQASSLELTPAG